MLPDAVWAVRDRLLASPRFQRFAARFAPTRPLARRRAAALFDLCAGFVHAQILFACVELRLFELLAGGPRSAGEVAAAVDLPVARAETLLLAATSLGLLAARRGGRFGLGPLGAALRGNPGVAAMIAHHAMLYDDLADPVALLRGARGAGMLAGYWAYAGTERPAALPPERVAAYTALMAASQPLVADEVLDATSLRGHRRLLDVGGGDGSFLRAVAARAPGLELMLFDLPPVAALAERRFAEARVAAQVFGGDMRCDPLPAGADVVSLVRVIHDHDDDAALTILRAVRRALPPGGTLLLAEPMRGAHAAADAYFDIYLLAMGQGRPRTPAALTMLLRAAGFSTIRSARTHHPMLVRVLMCK